MKFRSLHLLLLLAICPFVWLQSNQSKPQLYGYKKQNVYEKHPKLAEYFKNSPA
uniref:Uncharacterized protein n=1 Tax=Caenorhabditis japonica TaxID=281687 RepID=A0A8R1ICS0_CAEJA